jgi:hypothetical protein
VNREGCRPRPTILPRVRRLAFLLLLAACALAGCGGEDDTDDVENLLDRAFSSEIRSADLRLEAEIEMTGVLQEPIRIEAEGPFRTNEDKLPSADIELRIGADGGGQTVTSGVLTTGDRAFVKFQDVYYEQPPERVREANEALRRNSEGGNDRPLSELGLDPRSWLAEAEQEGDAEVAGVETRHVSGTLDVESLMRNLNRFVERSSNALGGAGAPAPPPRLSEADIRQLTEAVQDPSFDVYVGKADDIVRRVSGRVEFEIPKRSRAGLGGLDGGSIVFSVEFRDVNGDQQIEAPANARPLSDLTDSLGTGGLPGGLGGGGEEPDVPAPPDMPSGGSGGSDDPEAFRRYAECLDQARPEDTDELQRCAELLERP